MAELSRFLHAHTDLGPEFIGQSIALLSRLTARNAEDRPSARDLLQNEPLFQTTDVGFSEETIAQRLPEDHFELQVDPSSLTKALMERIVKLHGVE